MVIAAHIQKLFRRSLFHGINDVVLSLKNFDPRRIKLHRVLAASQTKKKKELNSLISLIFSKRFV